MIIIKRTQKIKDFVKKLNLGGKKIGFVPTMGALHDGHISLIKKSKSQNSLTICSIYVNPTQFNNVIDLNKYPVTLESDIDKLEMAACDVLFLPSTDEMYLNDEVNEHYDLGMLEHILEGKYRPGHFQGVCIIVDKLLTAIKPNTLYLGSITKLPDPQKEERALMKTRHWTSWHKLPPSKKRRAFFKL